MTQDGIEMLAAKNYNNDNENRILNSDTSQSTLNVGSLLFLPLNRVDCYHRHVPGDCCQLHRTCR